MGNFVSLVLIGDTHRGSHLPIWGVFAGTGLESMCFLLLHLALGLVSYSPEGHRRSV